MDINTNLAIQIALCALLFVAIFFLMRSTSRAEKKVKQLNKED